MIYRRYKYLADIAAGRRLLELGCGTGLGNHLFAASATSSLVRPRVRQRRQRPTQRAGYVRMLGRAGTPLLAGEPRRRGRFCEMIYYVPDHDRMLAEIRRVTPSGGVVFLAMANPERPGSTILLSARSIPAPVVPPSCSAGTAFEPELYGVFPLQNTPRARLLRFVARIATRFHLVPRTLAGRGFLKKIFFGELTPYRRPRRVCRGVRTRSRSRCGWTRSDGAPDTRFSMPSAAATDEGMDHRGR